jgi:antitoxin component YwqK of YwqJK toxin-antitoxin module
MKIHRTILVLSLLVFHFSCSERTSKTITMNKSDQSLMQRGKYLYHNGKPAEGMVVEYYASGKLKSETSYKNGLMDGRYKSWYEEVKKNLFDFICWVKKKACTWAGGQMEIQNLNISLRMDHIMAHSKNGMRMASSCIFLNMRMVRK